MDISVVIPTFNEAPNIDELVRRITAVLRGHEFEIVFVDDSTDTTPSVIAEIARTSTASVHLIHRAEPAGGLAGAVVEGLSTSTGEWCVVMDGDLQHPPELIPGLLDVGRASNADVAVASRRVAGGSSGGLGNPLRHTISTGATLLARAMFPIRLRDCTDPMTGFFAVRRSAIDLADLRPRGFKILLEILARTRLLVVEVPLVFGVRHAGRSKATASQGIRFLAQLAALRFGRMSGFALIGALGAVANLLIMSGLLTVGTWYLAAATISAVVTILGNFFLQERFVFRDVRSHNGVWSRFIHSVSFNLAEAALRTAVLWIIVELTSVHSVVAQAALLGLGFVVRFVYHSRVVYRPLELPRPRLLKQSGLRRARGSASTDRLPMA